MVRQLGDNSEVVKKGGALEYPIVLWLHCPAYSVNQHWHIAHISCLSICFFLILFVVSVESINLVSNHPIRPKKQASFFLLIGYVDQSH